MPRSAAPHRPSMADVGRTAGVSAQTVSRFVTGTGYVSAATRSRIAAAVEELGYRPHRGARSLRAKRSGVIGLLSVGELVHGSAQILTGVSQAARSLDQVLMIAQVDVGPEDSSGAEPWRREVRRALDHFLGEPVDGLLVSASYPGIEDDLAAARAQVPLVRLTELPHGAEGSVGTHSFAAALEGTRHLVAAGHRRILHLAGPEPRNEASERERGYRAAMTEAGLAPSVEGGAQDWSSESGARAAGRVEPGSFTGVLAANDEIALGFLSGMERRGLRAPRDYSIVGVDDMPAARYFSPPLTTLRLDFRGLGAMAVEGLHEMIGSGEAPTRRVVEPELVVRSSVGPPPAS